MPHLASLPHAPFWLHPSLGIGQNLVGTFTCSSRRDRVHHCQMADELEGRRLRHMRAPPGWPGSRHSQSSSTRAVVKLDAVINVSRGRWGPVYPSERRNEKVPQANAAGVHTMQLMPSQQLSSRRTVAGLKACSTPKAFTLVRPRRAAPSVLVQASTETAPAKPATISAKSVPAAELVKDGEISLTKISYGSILSPLGVGLLVYGFGAFFQLLPGADISSIMLIYGFPISILGFALSYAQLKPVPCLTTKAAFDLRATQMTDIQKQVREDTTRFRYGDELHLEEALDKIFRFNKQGGVPRKNIPTLIGLREEVTTDGRYTLVLEFESKLEIGEWENRQPKIQSFFGPGIEAFVTAVPNGVEVALVSDRSGAGRGGKERPDVLPPLQPGLKPRQQ